MGTNHSIKIDHNSDCWSELELLETMLKQNKRYNNQNFSASEIISIAVDELYDRINAEKMAGKNQRN